MIIVNYHELSPEGGSSRYDLPTGLFRAHLDTLSDQGFCFVTLAELLRQDPAAERPRQCAISFDDGRLGAYEHGARILRERRIRATYFICPEWLERRPTAVAECYSDFMTWDHVVELARDGHVIGSHGQSHLRFYETDTGTIGREVCESKRLIEERLGSACDHFAAPWGHIDRSVMSVVRHAGYRTLSSTAPGPNKLPYEWYRLRRLDASSYPSLASFSEAIRSHAAGHARLDVALLTVRGTRPGRADGLRSIGRFDLVVCLDDDSYELCLELGLRCLRQRPTAGAVRERLLAAHGDLVRDRELVFTPLTVG